MLVLQVLGLVPMGFVPGDLPPRISRLSAFCSVAWLPSRTLEQLSGLASVLVAEVVKSQNPNVLTTILSSRLGSQLN